jgi:cobalt/nickel transport system ATP-binding protein
MNTALEISDLTFSYPDGRQVLNKGERVALLGPNGAGKTTLVMHLNGILLSDQGIVKVAGIKVDKENLFEVRKRVGLVFQDPDDQLFMTTVRDDVAFGPSNIGIQGEELNKVVDYALDQVKMKEFADRPPHHLSFGQRRRVAVATVLAMKPDILVLDEPSSNLDPASRRELAEILLNLDVTIFMVTHDLPYALEICPRAAILNNGKIVADGNTRDLLGDEELMESNRLELPFGMHLDHIPHHR